MCEELARAGVLVAPGDCFGAPAYFRVGFGAQAAGFQPALDIFTHVLALTKSLPVKQARPNAIKIG
jgi:aspartate/methionine/tyrosine aminotransferase